MPIGLQHKNKLFILLDGQTFNSVYTIYKQRLTKSRSMEINPFLQFEHWLNNILMCWENNMRELIICKLEN